MNERIGWIGLGRIGAPMAQRVLDAGFELTLWARRRAAATPLLERGATWADAAAALLPRCDVICTVVTGPDEVQALQAALMPLARPGTLFIDMSTAAAAQRGRCPRSLHRNMGCKRSTHPSPAVWPARSAAR